MIRAGLSAKRHAGLLVWTKRQTLALRDFFVFTREQQSVEGTSKTTSPLQTDTLFCTRKWRRLELTQNIERLELKLQNGRQVMDINNIINFKKHIIPLTYTNKSSHCATLPSSCTIPFTYSCPIDKMKISARQPDLYYQKVKEFFSDKFIFNATNKVNSNIVTSYYYEDKEIQLILYGTKNKSHFFSIIIHDPDYKTQSIVRDILMSLSNDISDTVYLTQIEFDLDLYFDDHSNLYLAKSIVDKNIYLRFSRRNSYLNIETTEYQCKDCNVNKGTKSLRCYPKNQNNGKFERIELVANRNMIKKLNLDLCSMPIDHDIVNFSKYV